MNYLYILFVGLVFACGSDDESNGPNTTPENTGIVVKAQATYPVQIEENIEYAQGLSHQSINSEEYEEMPLLMDIYYPDNDVENRPLYLFIHGGGYIGGSRKQSTIINLANYYTSRGWVFASIDYRLSGDLGTVPQDWVDYASFIPSELVAQYYALYPAIRDAKAALRWLVANSNQYQIDLDYITVGGGSAGAATAIALGVTNPEDFRDEISIEEDPSLASTNLQSSYNIKTIIDYWGTDSPVNALDMVFNLQSFDSSDPPLLVAHGTADLIVLFSEAEDLQNTYESLNLPLAYYPLEGKGHAAWNATVNGKRIEELAFDFIVEQQGLRVE